MSKMPLAAELDACADFEFAALAQARNYRAALIRIFSRYLTGNVLEIGAGIGQLTELLLSVAGISKLVSVEPDARFCERLRASFPRHTILQGIAREVATGQDWDAVLSVNVLEHIKDDADELALYARLLAQRKGTFCLFVPARPEIYAPLDRDFGHFRRYTRPELRRKLEEAGFEVRRLFYFNFVGYFLWWFNFRLLKSRRFNPRGVRLFDRIIFPPVFAIENRGFHPPIGQSLVAVATPA